VSLRIKESFSKCGNAAYIYVKGVFLSASQNALPFDDVSQIKSNESHRRLWDDILCKTILVYPLISIPLTFTFANMDKIVSGEEKA
jgi:hypothetical protein